MSNIVKAGAKTVKEIVIPMLDSPMLLSFLDKTVIDHKDSYRIIELKFLVAEKKEDQEDQPIVR